MKTGAIAVAISTAILMLYSGLLFDPVVIRGQFNRKSLRWFGRLVLANYLVIPLLTLGAIWLFSFSSVLNLVLLTMTMLPCASLVPPLVSIAGEPPEWALFVFLSMSVLNIAMVPLLMGLLTLPWIAGDGGPMGGGDSSALTRYVLAVYGPMSIGVAMRIFFPRYAPKLMLFLRQALMPLMLSTFGLFIYSYREELLSLGLHDLGVFVLFESLCIAAGLVFAQRTVVDGNSTRRISTMLICSLRNVSMGIVFCVIVFPRTAASTYMMAFTNLMFAGVAIWLGINKRMMGRQDQAGIKPLE